MRLKTLLLSILLLLSISLSLSWAESLPLSRLKKAQDVIGSNGMVTADHALASQIGVDMLALGGDSVDGAVATALALGVLQPFASGLGGGGFAVIWRQDEKKSYAFDFREIAPIKAYQSMYVDAQGKLIPKASTEGVLAVAVPSELLGLYTLHQKYGKLPWKTVVKPALTLTKDGFEMHELLYERIIEAKTLIQKNPTLSRWFLNGDQPKAMGSKITCPELAQSLEEIALLGAKALTEGQLGKQIIEGIQKDGGILSMDDFQQYQVKERTPLMGSFKGFDLITMPPPSSGGVVLLQILNTLSEIDLKALKHNSVEYLHRLTESMKHAFADRALYLGDPDFVKVPISQMLSESRKKQILASFHPDHTLTTDQYGGKYEMTKDGGTSHFNVIDKQGNAVALTTTINTTFGSGYIAGNTGIVLNNEMDDFVAQPNVPNAFGLVGLASNAIQPKKKPLSSMTPTIILKDQRVKAMVGASGGPTIITSTLQVLLSMLVFEQTPAEAVNQLRIHHQWRPEKLLVDQGLEQSLIDGLTEKKHDVKAWIRFSASQALVIKEQIMIGASDPTKRGVPAVVQKSIEK